MPEKLRLVESTLMQMGASCDNTTGGARFTLNAGVILLVAYRHTVPLIVASHWRLEEPNYAQWT